MICCIVGLTSRISTLIHASFVCCCIRYLSSNDQFQWPYRGNYYINNEFHIKAEFLWIIVVRHSNIQMLLRKIKWKSRTLKFGDVYFVDPYLAFQFQSGTSFSDIHSLLNKWQYEAGCFCSRLKLIRWIWKHTESNGCIWLSGKKMTT